jgi:hypothetical protein
MASAYYRHSPDHRQMIQRRASCVQAQQRTQRLRAEVEDLFRTLFGQSFERWQLRRLYRQAPLFYRDGP